MISFIIHSDIYFYSLFTITFIKWCVYVNVLHDQWTEENLLKCCHMKSTIHQTLENIVKFFIFSIYHWPINIEWYQDGNAVWHRWSQQRCWFLLFPVQWRFIYWYKWTCTHFSQLSLLGCGYVGGGGRWGLNCELGRAGS